MAKKLITLLKKLVSFQSDKNHPQEIKKCFDFAVSWLRKRGLKVKTYSSNNNPSLVAARKLKKHYQYILNGHLDVVPADYKNAFKPIIKAGRLYARGASDMKGTVAAMMILMAKIKTGIANFSSRSLKPDVALMLTTDEEVGGFNGVNFLLNKKAYSCDCAVVPDGGSNWQLVLAEKGIIHIKLQAKGKAVHGSRPWLGENAIEKLIKVYQTLKKQLPMPKTKKHWYPTVNLGQIQGGKATNIVPGKAAMSLDFRYPLKKQRKKILNLLAMACQKQKGVSWQIKVEGQPMAVAKNNPYIKKISKIFKQKKIKFNFDLCHGASDGRFFAEKNIPVVMFAPKSSPAHIKNEWVNLKSLLKFSQVLKAFLLTETVV